MQNNKTMCDKKDNMTFDKVIERTASFVTIGGLLAIILQMCSFQNELKENKANELIIDAVSIFNAASDTTEYQKALNLFLEVKRDRPKNLTGYNLFLELANSRADAIKEDNNKIKNIKIYEYDREVEIYLQYADSLNDMKPNTAKKQLDNLQKLKANEK